HPGGYTIRRFRAWPDRSPHLHVAPGLARFLRTSAGRYDLIHAHNYNATPALLAALFTVGPIVFTPHYHERSASAFRNALHSPYQALGRRILARSSRVICVSPYEARIFAERFPGVAHKTTVIPNGTRRRPSGGSPPRQPNLLTVGRLVDHKRVDKLIDAIALLDPEIHATVVGDGPSRSALEAQVASRGLGDRVRIRGFVDDLGLDECYQNASVFVALSEQEAFGMTLAEALAAGLPVVASNIGAHVDVASLAPDNCSLVAVDADASAIAKAISAAMLRPRQTVTSLPTWSEVADATLEVYGQVLRGQAGPSR
ncbi:MAG: glycosyltransferase family 4 protein, partial [Microthrixaceae bacterium]